MTVVIGYWLICLAVTIFIVGIADDGDFKDKVKLVVFIMSFITLLMIGVFLLAV